MAHSTLLTPPVSDMSRSKLKQIAHWIRDDLDILVAREGPNALRPDDVLTLHELFVALRQPATITVRDLRASGIHKAVRDIAGIATRWPGRLCDDCDKIISIWTSKFGRLDDLHPFLYGRGGRLEGIASVSEYTREALLKRWSEQCPEKIHPKVSHRGGDLGFRAGDWWINPLFAHHAGIIGLESVDGGTTYDKNGAYALVLKDSGQIDARCDQFFAYRSPVNDKGKFRLTAATPISRDPIRVLRSHSINSIWGPKAGIRYEGLYSVTGWCVRQAKPKDANSGEWKEGDIIYEITLQRRDPVSMEEVSRRPTNMEVDDYAEYKRLRKLHREHTRKGAGPLPMPEEVSKIAPPVLPLQPLGSAPVAPQSLLRISPSVSRKTTFKEPDFDASNALHGSDRPLTADVVSPMTMPGLQESFFSPKHSGTLAIPFIRDKGKHGLGTSSNAISSEKLVPVLSLGTSSLDSSNQSDKKDLKEDLKEIIPWIELEEDLTVSSPLDTPSIMQSQRSSGVMDRLEVKAAELNPVKSVRRLARDSRHASNPSLRSHGTSEKSTASNALKLRLRPAKPIFDTKDKGKDNEKGKEHKKITLKIPKLFDGAGDRVGGDGDYQRVPLHSRARHVRSSSADGVPQLQASKLIRTRTSNSLFATHHDRTHTHGIEDIEFTSSLEHLTSLPLMATLSSISMSPPTMAQGGRQDSEGRSVFGRWWRMMSK